MNIPEMLWFSVHSLDQACTTYGKRANCCPRKLFYMACKTPNLVYFACLFDKNILRMCQNISTFGPWICEKNLGPTMRFELCTPVLDCLRQTVIPNRGAFRMLWVPPTIGFYKVWGVPTNVGVSIKITANQKFWNTSA